jgi:hypothetical protein
VDDIEVFRSDEFDPASIDSRLRAFYEETNGFDLTVVPTWHRGFRNVARAYKRFSSRVGQMSLPLESQDGSVGVSSQIVPIASASDSRGNVRAWIRTADDTGDVLYVAAYAVHTDEHRTYMNIAFPTPGGNLTSILRIDPASTGSRIALTSRGDTAWHGDEGVYAVWKGKPLRLPINETIVVEADGDELVARHDVWMLGLPAVTLAYRMVRRA